MKTDLSDIGLIVIDMQEIFVRNLREGDANRIIPNQLIILRFCAKNNIPVVVLELHKCEYGKTIPIILNEVMKNSNFCIISKRYDDGFENTNLHVHLTSLGIKKLILIGINADYCVKDTANSAISRGYKIITSNELIGGQTHHVEDNNVGWFKSNGNYFSRIEDFEKSLITV